MYTHLYVLFLLVRERVRNFEIFNLLSMLISVLWPVLNYVGIMVVVLNNFDGIRNYMVSGDE